MTGKNTLSNLANVTAGKVRTSGITAFNELVITKVYPNPDQPRKQFDDIEELAANIKEHGLLQPIAVVKKDDGYMIVSGERRYKAHLHNGAKTIMALILTSTDEQVEELTLIENIQRSDLTDFEVAKYICKLWESGRYAKKSDLANRIGKSDSFVSKAFSCFKLDSEIIDHIEENKKDIPISVMDEIARVGDADTQKKVYEKYNNKEITRDEIKDFKPKKTIKEKVEEIFINPPISCNYVEQNFPREKSFSEQLDEANKLENKFTQLINDGYRDYNSEIEINNSYERIIYRLILQKSPKEVNNKVNKINLCISNKDGYTQNSSAELTFLSSDGCSTTLNNRYDEIIFDLLKENLELKKKLEQLKQNVSIDKVQTMEEEPITKNVESKENDKNIAAQDKKIKLVEAFANAVTIQYTNNVVCMDLTYAQARKIIEKSNQESITFDTFKGGVERIYQLIDENKREVVGNSLCILKQLSE